MLPCWSLRLTVAWLALVSLLFGRSAALAGEPEIWLSPLGSAYNGKGWGASDLMELFKFDDRWQETRNTVKVDKAIPQFRCVSYQ